MSEKRTRANGQGSIWFDDTRQRWCVKVMVDGKPRRAFVSGYDNKMKALTKLDTLRVLAAENAAAPDGNMTVGELLDSFRQRDLVEREIADKTLELYDWALAIIRAELGTHRLKTLTSNDIRDMLNRRVRPAKFTGTKVRRTGATGQATRPLGLTSVRKVLATLRQALDWAVLERIVTYNVCTNIRPPKAAAKPKPARSMTMAQANAFLAAATGTEYETMWIVMMMVGLRPAEAAGLYWQDLDIDRVSGTGIVHVRRSVKKGGVVTAVLKSKTSSRDLELPGTVVAALIRLDDMRRHQDPRFDSPLVFTNAFSGKALDGFKVRQEFRKVAATAGLDTSWHPHELRHTNASLLHATGISTEGIQKNHGHAESRTTETLYIHPIDERPQTASRIGMDQLFPRND